MGGILDKMRGLHRTSHRIIKVCVSRASTSSTLASTVKRWYVVSVIFPIVFDSLRCWISPIGIFRTASSRLASVSLFIDISIRRWKSSVVVSDSISIQRNNIGLRPIRHNGSVRCNGSLLNLHHVLHHTTKPPHMLFDRVSITLATFSALTLTPFLPSTALRL